MLEEETPTVEGEKPTVDVEVPDATTGDAEPVKAEAEETPKPKPSGVQKRIDKLTREKYEAEQRARDAEERLKQVAPKQSEAPKRSDYDDYESYLEVKAEFIAEQKATEALKKREAEESRRTQETQVRESWANWESRKETARDKYQDFDEVINQDVPITGAMQQAIMESDAGADIAYYFGNHPDEAERIAKLSPARQFIEIGKLELKVNDPPKKSAAPAPIDPVKPSGATDNPKPNDKDSDEVWMAKRRKQVYGK